MSIAIRSWLYASTVLIATAAGGVWAANDTPVGTWKTIDDATGKAKSLVTISEDGGKLHGKVVKLFNPSKPDPTCEKCDGKRKDQPIMGMEILWGLQKDGEQWDGGQILDPEKGKIYGAKLSLADHGNKLDVRGFMGFSLIGRTQTWIRESEAPPPTSAP